MVNTDDLILTGTHKDKVDQVIQDIQDAKIRIRIEGYINYFLGINIDSKKYGSIHLAKPHLIDQILEDIKMGKTTESSSQLLLRHTYLPYFGK